MDETQTTQTPTQQKRTALTMIPGGRPNLDALVQDVSHAVEARGGSLFIRMQPNLWMPSTVDGKPGRYMGWPGVIWKAEFASPEELVRFRDELDTFVQEWFLRAGAASAPRSPLRWLRWSRADMADFHIGQRFYRAYIQSGGVHFYTTDIVAMSPKLIRVNFRTPITNYREQNTLAQMEECATTQAQAVERLKIDLLRDRQRAEVEVEAARADIDIVGMWREAEA